MPKPKRLVLALYGEWFDKIRDGEKPEEYRVATDYWEKRLEGRSYDEIVLLRGYPKGGGVEGVTRLTRKWKGCQRKTIVHPFYDNVPTEVFALDVTEKVDA